MESWQETLAPFEAWLGAHLWAYSQRPVLTRVVPPKRGRRGEGLTRHWGKTKGKGTVRGHFAPSFLSFGSSAFSHGAMAEHAEGQVGQHSTTEWALG